MADVHVLPGAVCLETEQRVAPQESLMGALDAGLQDVAIVGRRIDGEICVWGSHEDQDATLGLLARGVHYVAQRKQVSG